MQLCHGWSRRAIVLSPAQRYHPEQLADRLSPPTDRKPASPLVWMPVWLLMEGKYVRLQSKDEISLACKLVCIYHNGPYEDTPYFEQEDGDWQDISEKEAFLAEEGDDDEAVNV